MVPTTMHCTYRGRELSSLFLVLLLGLGAAISACIEPVEDVSDVWVQLKEVETDLSGEQEFTIGFDRERDFAVEGCGEPLETAFEPGPRARDEGGVAHYRARLEGTEAEVQLVGAEDEDLGVFAFSVRLDSELTTGVILGWEIDQVLYEQGTAAASQRIRGRNLAGQRTFLEIEHQAAGAALTQWAVLDADWDVVQMSIALPWTGAPDDPDALLTQTADGRVLETLVVRAQGQERLPQSDVDAWLESRLVGAFDASDAWQRLQAVGDDLVLREGLDAHVRVCRAAGIEDAEDHYFGEPKMGCVPGTTAGPKRCRQEAIDEIVDGLQVLLSINDVMGHVGTGAAITAGLVAAGVVVSGPAIGVAFVGGVATSILISSAVDSFFERHGDSVVGGLGVVGAAATGGSSDDARAFRDFFAGSGGDPWFDTLDGMAYPYHGLGEFTLVEALEGAPFHVQVRHVPVGGVCSGVALTSAAAVLVGESRVNFDIDDDAYVRVDGQPVSLPGGILPLDGGAVLEVVDPGRGRMEIRWPTGERLGVFRNVQGFVDLRLALPESRRSAVRGLLGNFSGNRGDDFTTREGLVLEQPIGWDVLNGVFGESWRVPSGASLFHYRAGQSPEDFADPGFPEGPTRLDDLPVEDRENAEALCSDAGIDAEHHLEACIIDVVCTGDPSLVDSHADRSSEVPAEVEEHTDPIACLRPGEAVVGADIGGPSAAFYCPSGCYETGVTRLKGTDVYTGDSFICAAAIHAGVVTREQGGSVLVEPMEGPDRYQGTERNGLLSFAFSRPWSSSFQVSTPPTDPCTVQGAGIVSRVTDAPGEPAFFSCPPGCVARVNGRVWGVDIYTDDSSICSAAVHAGVITDELGGPLWVQAVPSLSSYEGSVRNGVSSSSWGSWPGAFMVLPYAP